MTTKYCSTSNNYSTELLFALIHSAHVFNRHILHVKSLLQKHADIEARDFKGRTPLLLASLHRRKRAANLLIKSGANVDYCNGAGSTVLHCAAANGWPKMVRLLAKKVRNLDARNIRGETAMHLATRAGHVKVVKCLLNAGADIDPKNIVDFTPLICAVECSRKAVFDLLLDSGASVAGIEKLLLYYASFNNWTEVVRLLVKRVPDLNIRYVMGKTVLDASSSRGHLDVVKFLVGEGIVINTRDKMIGQAALFRASIRGHLEVMKWLVQKVPYLNARDCFGETALHHASNDGNLEMVKCLVEEGADINTKYEIGGTALHKAAAVGNVEVVKYLMEQGARINTRNEIGQAALHKASSYNHLEVASYNQLELVKYLVEQGADINARDEYGRTALHAVSSNGNLEGMKYLVEKGANINSKHVNGTTAVLYAAQINCRAAVDLLMHLGPNLDAFNQNALMYLATMSGWVDIVRLLVKSGCDLDGRIVLGTTALHSACIYKRIDVVKYLLQEGASWDIASVHGGYTPLNYLTKNRNPSPEFIKLFIENGAYLKPEDYKDLMKSNSLEVLQDAKLSCLAIVNKFNNHSLAELYKLPVAKCLPRIEEMKITRGSKVIQEIERTVKFEIETKGHCNVLEVRHMSLSVFSVRSILEYFENK